MQMTRDATETDKLRRRAIQQEFDRAAKSARWTPSVESPPIAAGPEHEDVTEEVTEDDGQDNYDANHISIDEEKAAVATRPFEQTDPEVTSDPTVQHQVPMEHVRGELRFDLSPAIIHELTEHILRSCCRHRT